MSDLFFNAQKSHEENSCVILTFDVRPSPILKGPVPNEPIDGTIFWNLDGGLVCVRLVIHASTQRPRTLYSSLVNAVYGAIVPSCADSIVDIVNAISIVVLTLTRVRRVASTPSEGLVSVKAASSISRETV